MKIRVLFALMLTGLLCAGWTWDEDRADRFPGPRVDVHPAKSAPKETTDPRLDELASKIAGHPITVGCYKPEEENSPDSYGAWGYVYMGTDYEYMDQTVCDGILGFLDHTNVAAWKIAVGVLVITHESYHLNLNVKDAGNEAKTECRAIRNFASTVRRLGGTEDQVGYLLPYGLAIHWRIAARYSEYYLKGCKVPNWW